MDGMNSLTGLGVNIHIRLLDGSLPVVVLGGKLDGVALGVEVHLFGTGPQVTADPVAVFVPRGDRLHSNGGIETHASSSTSGW